MLVWSWIEAAWFWTRQNGQPLGLIVTAAGVVAAIVYALLTKRLVEAARTQADAALHQAKVTRQIFEAAQRPYLEVTIDPWSFCNGPTFYSTVFVLKNHGQVPAILTAWRVAVRQGDTLVAERPHGPPDAATCVFPEAEAQLQLAGGVRGIVQEPSGGSDVEVVVEYQGVQEASYTSELKVSGRRTQWTSRALRIT